MEVMLPAVIAFVVLFLVVKFFSLSFSLVWNGLVGVVMLWLLNMVGGLIGIHLEISVITALIAGFFGIPGIVVMLIYNLIK
ncbi:MAG: pro-sigmaK processing inhibitor BofA family protein [Acidaminococcaceae bacterium]|jgi:inhibitor of the pro-sigma K processing machinery|nr:pro-sigmaK processing inhibitor BofA family protein [Acidaminococcaceae bacterium]